MTPASRVPASTGARIATACARRRLPFASVGAPATARTAVPPAATATACGRAMRRADGNRPARARGAHAAGGAAPAAARDRAWLHRASCDLTRATLLSSDAYADAADKPEGTDTHDLGAGGGLGPALDVLAAQQHEPADDDADVGGDDERDAAEQGDLDDVELRASELGLGQVEVHAAEQTDVQETARQTQPAGEPDTAEERD